jgi:Fe-S oxidoreductase
MPDPATLHYLGMPGYAILWMLALVSFSVFADRVWRHIRVLSHARPEKRWDHIGKRISLVVINVLGQRRLLDEPLIGAAHLVIFWAFIFYAITFFWNLVRGLIPALPIPYSDEVPWVVFSLETLGALAVVALVVAAVRRYLFTPVSLERSGDATIILVLISVVLLSYLASAGFQALAANGQETWRPVGRVLGTVFASLGVAWARAPDLYLWTWWIHIITVLGFLAYLPYSKHLHLLASPFAVFSTSLEPSRMPAASEGAARLEEFTWRQMFNGLACAECGRCDRACPSFTSGDALSPKHLIHHVKELVLASQGRAVAREAVGNGKRFLGDVVRPEDIWACTTCGSCMEHCPVFNEHIPLLIEMRRKLLTEGELPPRLQEALTNLTRYGNSFGESERKRAVWTRGLDFKPKDARKEAVQWLWYLGEYACYHPVLQGITRSLARVLRTAGVDYGILYEAERNSGNDVRRVGEEGLFELLRDKNTATMQQARFNDLFTTDPHVYNTFRNEYPGLNHGRHKVYHYTQLLAALIQRGQLKPSHALPYRVTYHDPCYLGRYNGVYGAPRTVLRALGVELKEMPRSRRDSFCCGGGGGRVWMEEIGDTHSRPSESRVREAASLDGVKYLVVACPKDYVMFTDALKTTGLEGRLLIKDIAELVEEARTV